MKMHNVITDNLKKSQDWNMQLFNLTTQRLQRPQLPQKHNVRIKSSARNDHRPPWHKLKDNTTDAQLQQWWCENGILNDVTLMSSLRSLVQVVMAPFIFFSVALNVKMNYERNYKNLLNFVTVMLKILVVPFFSGRGVV